MAKQDKRIGNQFWRNVPIDKLGRPAKFKTPEELWEAAKDYFDFCDNNPIFNEETKTSSNGTQVTENRLKIPYTWEGLYIHLSVVHLDHYKTKNDFLGILTHIGNIIRNQKFMGATVGIFNHGIIARDLGLMENSKIDVTTKGESINRGELTPDQVKKIADNLEDEI